MKRTIHVQLIVDPGKNMYQQLVEATAKHLSSLGFEVTLPHIYPEEPLIVEIRETLPTLTY